MQVSPNCRPRLLPVHRHPPGAPDESIRDSQQQFPAVIDLVAGRPAQWAVFLMTYLGLGEEA